MATSAIQVCSNALLLLGQASINSFDEDKTQLTPNLWDTCRQSTLRLGQWACARKRVTLSPLATKPGFGWTYLFQLPSDLLRTISIGERGEFFDYEIDNGQLLADEATIKLRYVYDNLNPASWDALLVEATTLHMAWLLAYAITGSSTKADALGTQFSAFLKMARGVNHSETPGETMGDSPLLTSRFNGGNGRFAR